MTASVCMTGGCPIPFRAAIVKAMAARTALELGIDGPSASARLLVAGLLLPR